MLFSRAFDITKEDADDWFDPILESDTELFVDPFLIFKERSTDWRGAHEVLIQHFDALFSLLAKSGGDQRSPYYTKTVGLLLFPEPQEFCLGYTAAGVRGLGGGAGLAKDIARAMSAAIDRGIKNLQHFELLGIFNTGIGPDRISDLTCTLLKQYFIDYTLQVAKRHSITTMPHRIGFAGVEAGEWVEIEASLPTNPYNNKPILLAPRRFLRRLPTLNADDWWQWYGLRPNLNITVLENVDKKAIVAAALSHQGEVAAWVAEQERKRRRPYDLSVDPDLVWLWEPLTLAFALANPIDVARQKRRRDFHAVLETIVGQYKHYIENEGGWRLLWNDDRSEKHEDAAQNLFRGIAKHYCNANDIAIDREVNLGRGPVDFKFSRGAHLKVHLEVKKLTSGGFWQGIESQLLTYMDSDETEDGWFLAIQLRGGGVSKKRVRELPKTVERVATENGVSLRYAVVDGRRKVSASKRRT